MLRHPAEILHVLPDKLRRSMMVVEYGEDAIEKDVIGLPYPHIDGEQGVYDNIDKQMQLLF